nr:MAG TPA: hypothetical protein [Caudoviricetes sp.]
MVYLFDAFLNASELSQRSYLENDAFSIASFLNHL